MATKYPSHLLVAKSEFKRPAEGLLSNLPLPKYKAGAPIALSGDNAEAIATELLSYRLAESAATGAGQLDPVLTEDAKDFQHEVRRVLDPEAEGGVQAYARFSDGGEAPEAGEATWFRVDRATGKVDGRSRKGLPENKVVQPVTAPASAPTPPAPAEPKGAK